MIGFILYRMFWAFCSNNHPLQDLVMFKIRTFYTNLSNPKITQGGLHLFYNLVACIQLKYSTPQEPFLLLIEALGEVNNIFIIYSCNLK